MEIKIDGTLYPIKYTIRALFIYEQITGKVFKMATLTDEYLFFYCLLLANNPNTTLSFDSFIDLCDEDMNIILAFKEFVSKEMEKQTVFLQREVEGKKKV